ncbi:MAG: PD-(D/E)XK nuclease family protein [Akkermansia sp.]|nr:PD-(D/E)XK nuclease family protein [Akkermansia sp.]
MQNPPWYDKVTAYMNTPDLRTFIGWHRPAIELVAEKLLTLNEHEPQRFRRATVVVPTSGSGRRLREYMAEQAGRPILMPKIVLAGQLIPCKGEHIATEEETLAAWLQVLGLDGTDPVAQYAPLIPRRPDKHRKRWAVGVAHKLMALRNRLEQEEITVDDVTEQLIHREKLLQQDISRRPSDEAEARTLRARKAVLANEHARWKKLGELFTKVDSILLSQGKTPAQQERERQINIPDKRSTDERPVNDCPDLLIVACLPEFSPQLKRYLENLHTHRRFEVQLWVNAPNTERTHFDSMGHPLEAIWNKRDIDIPHGMVYADAEKSIQDNEASCIHIVDGVADLANEALRLAGGRASDEVVIATGNAEYTPTLLSRFRNPKCGTAWQLNAPEGRALLTTDAGRLPEQLADYCAALQEFEGEDTTEGGMRVLNAFIALLCNRALQKALKAPAAVQENLQQHLERLRALLMPASVRQLCDYLNPAVELPTADYRELQFFAGTRKEGYYKYVAETALPFINDCCRLNEQPQRLRELHLALKANYEESPLKTAIRKLCSIIDKVRDEKFVAKIADAATLLEILRYYTQDKGISIHTASERTDTVGEVLGWRELAYTREQRIIIAAMHDGCIPEPVQQDEFLPESLCKELGIKIRHEDFRMARDTFLLTALLQSRTAGEVHFIVTRQNPDGTGVAPSSLLLRCAEELPYRARIMFAESHTATTPPTVALCPLQQAAPGPEQNGKITPGMMESITQIAPHTKNPFTEGQRTYSPSLLSGFLQCPFSFWLNHLYGLDAGNVYNEDKSELESNEYGTIIHAVLQKVVEAIPSQEKLEAAFPEAETRVARIEALVQYTQQIGLEEWSRVYMRNGARQAQTLPMEVLLRNMEQSLHDFAVRHVNDLADGWCNLRCEYMLTPTLTLSNGEQVAFKMIADRIDRHIDGRWRIIDYKTSSQDKKPFKQHFEELEDGEDSAFYRFMNAAGYQYPLVTTEFEHKEETKKKFYRWKDVQLMLYAYGLRQLNAKDIHPSCAEESLKDVMPELFYYNLHIKTLRMQCYPLVNEKGLCPVPGKGKATGYFCHTPESLLKNAMQTVDSAIRMIRDGVCLFSAEALKLKNRPFSKLTGDNKSKNAPRFGAISPKCDPRSLFNLPELNI